MNATITLPNYALLAIGIVLAALALGLSALSVNRSSVRQHLDLSPISDRTDRSDCHRPGCTTVHPGTGRHRSDPRPDGPTTVIVATLACALRTPQRGRHGMY